MQSLTKAGYFLGRNVALWGKGGPIPKKLQFLKKKVIGLVKNMIFSHQAKFKEDAFNIVKGTEHT